ncbi:hypothetical protein EK21DRAFT_113080 [Setomelanomma holmii]|uniref:Uncharacterized protein n=1 Tax=Setomelanomma holmii TaxID=210430 RepID=A0A9P4H740_9PLEO|nr:hypothetical protein EK21DRAFT_113080 [Setomelanomma holmii]
MSTHFRPLPPRTTPTPSSPVRPSTAHSTIRAVTPSPPASANEACRPTFPLSRPKSEHALGSAELATYLRYVVNAENDGFGPSPEGAMSGGTGLKRGGAMSGRSSPVKRRSRDRSRSRSPTKRTRVFSTPPGLAAYAKAPERSGADSQEQDVVITTHGNAVDGAIQEAKADEEEDDDDECPDTPTPMTHEQKRQAYTPLGALRPLRSPPTAPPSHPDSTIPPHTTTPIPPLSGAQHQAQPAPQLQSSHPRKPTPNHPANRMSISAWSKGSALSAASKHSIFSTPGRDELERKKALVEVDGGPFARVQSMMDLDEERRRISSGGGTEKGKSGFGIKCGCVIM